MQDIHVVLGVTGGIAAYKACDIVSRLKKLNAHVDVIMTQSACQFVAPLTFQSLAYSRVVVDMFEEPKVWEIEHIALAKKADVFVIAPATANIIGKIASGIADDMLSTTVMATRAPVLIAPAMNTAMYENPIVQQNIAKLQALGYYFVEPESGRLACDDIGKGKLAQPQTIIDAIEQIVYPNKALSGKKVMITAGPTVEALDPVRYLTNRSTGKMGYQLAAVAHRMGADVTLLSGPTKLAPPLGVNAINFQSADQLYDLVTGQVNQYDILISAAAVADYKPAQYLNQKIKKSDDDLAIPLARNRDIAKAVGANKGRLISIGFSVETENVIENSLKKLNAKQFDFIVVNDVTQEGAGFASDTNIVTIIDANGQTQALPKMSKWQVAEKILQRAATLL